MPHYTRTMNLFRMFQDNPANLLPMDGTAYYYGHLLSQEAADSALHDLMTGIPWRNDEMMMFGKHVVTARKVAWFGDRAYDYMYSGIVHTSHIWTPELLALRESVEQVTGHVFNSCLLNLYNHGGEGLGWHSDDEKELGENSVIASLSLGAERRFLFQHKQTGQRVEVLLEHGSLLLMSGTTQQHWLHSVPKMAKVKEPRINLTFRQIKK